MKKARIDIRVEPYLLDLYKEQSKKCGMDLSQWIRYILRKQIPVSELILAQKEEIKNEDYKKTGS